MSFQILDRWTSKVIYTSETADSMSAAVKEANLSGANLSYADLSGADLERMTIIMIGSRHVITAYPNKCRIGCHERTYKSWLKVYREVGNREYYTPEQIEEYGELIRKAQAMFSCVEVKNESTK